MSRKALEAKRAEYQKQIEQHSGSDYWWNMVGAAMQIQIEVIDAMLAED